MGTIRKKVGSYKPKEKNIEKLTKYLEKINNKNVKKLLYQYGKCY